MSLEQDREIITERLFDYMKDHGISQASLADSTGITRSTMHYMLHRKNSIPAECIIPIAEYLNVTPLWLLTGKDDLPAMKEIVERFAPEYTEDEKELIRLYRELDREGRTKILYFSYQEKTRVREENERQEREYEKQQENASFNNPPKEKEDSQTTA